jgi:hypothetical protein
MQPANIAAIEINRNIINTTPLKTLPLIFCSVLSAFSIPVFGQTELILPLGHTDHVVGAQFSGDGKYIVTAGDNTAKIWEKVRVSSFTH